MCNDPFQLPINYKKNFLVINIDFISAIKKIYGGGYIIVK